jgi:glycosyltransferase involved in cell wall biosynthesis
LKVALLTPCYPPEVNRGTERVVREIADGLLAEGCSPRVITSHPGVTTRSVEDGLPVIRHWRPPDRPLLRRGFQEHLTHLPFSYASLRSGSDDLAHAHYPTDASVAVRWGRETGRPVAFTYHGIPQREVLAARRLRLRLVVEALSGSDRVIVSSDAAGRAMKRWLGIDPVTVHPSVRADFFVAEEERLEVPTLICAAAPDDPRKRIPLLIRAFQRLRHHHRRAELMLLRPADPRLAARYSELAGVRLFDPVTEPRELARLFSRAWVSVLAARNEAFGLVLAESLAAGTPGVGARDGGVPEIISDERVGRTFDTDDEDGLLEAMLESLELALDPGTADVCRQHAERFAGGRMADEHLSLYRGMLERSA